MNTSASSKHIAEYAALRALGALIGVLPYRAALGVGWVGARISFRLIPRRTQEAQRRIREVFGDRFSDAEIRRIAWKSWLNVVFDGIELILEPRMDEAWIRGVFGPADYIAPILDVCASGRGAIIAVPHMGNWEMAAVMCHRAGIPIFSVAATQKNPLTNAYINRLRRSPGIETLARGSGAMKEIIRRLRSGQVLAILPDVRSPTPGVQVPFLGQTANLGKGTGLFARHADVPVFPCAVRRAGWSRHTGTVYPAIWPDTTLDKEQDAHRITGLVVAALEKEIRAHPGDWFWYNKRWVLDPPPATSRP
jgi:Kdo2-lipid IVA lauroyltransferase/acyltransferase